MVTQPSILNGPTVYETGAGGGNINFFTEQIKNKKYPCVKIKNLIFCCGNLNDNFDGVSNSFSLNSACGITKSDCYLFGKYYNYYAIPIIENWLLNNTDGWRIPTKQDYENLLEYDVGDLKSPISWDNLGQINYKTGFSALATGFYNLDTFYSVGVESYFATSTKEDDKYYYAFMGNDNEEQIKIKNTYGGSANANCWPIRLCKDV